MLARKDHQRTRAILGRKLRHWKTLRGRISGDEQPEDLPILPQGDCTEAWEHVDHCDAPTATTIYERFTAWLFSMLRRPARMRAVGTTS